MRKIFTAILIFTTGSLISQTFTSSPDFFLPDDGGTYNFEIEVTGLPDLVDMSFGLERACVNLTHTWDADIRMWLQSPDGSTVELSTDNGGSEDNYMVTCFTENAFFQVTDGSPPYNGNFNPEGNLNDINNGQNPNGTWTLIYFDTYAGADTGTFNEWGLFFTDELVDPEPNPFDFESSNLPLIYINTFSQAIPDEPGIIAEIEIIDNGEGNLNYINDPITYVGIIDIETRGQSTQSFPKKSYSFELNDEFGFDMDTTVLGLPTEEDWILYAPYSEKSLLQNWLTFELGNEMGDYHSRTRFCEVIVNNMYNGIYMMMEKIKVDPNRVDIADLTPLDNEGDELTGGYVWRIDWGGETGWYTQFPIPADPNAYLYYQFYAPQPEVVTPQQQAYLKSYVDSFEYALNNPTFYFGGKRYDEFIDLNSYVDNFIMNEVAKNVDGYRLSSYFYKDKDSNGGKMKAGPLWDFNLSMGNADYCDGSDVTDWMYQSCGNIGPFWWPRFVQDSVFTNLLKCRWDYLRTNTFSEEHLHTLIDSMAAHLDSGAAERNFERWPVLGIYVWPNSAPYATSYAEAIQQLKDWLDGRLLWLDENITGEPVCIPYLTNNAVNIENFEGENFPPNCWTVYDADSDGYNWMGSTPVGGYQSEHCAYSNSFATQNLELDPDNYLITPKLLPQNEEHLTFYITGQPGGFSEHYQVLLSTTGNSTEDFTTILWEETISTEQWQYRAVDLQNWWGQEIYIAFRHFNSAGNLMFRLDDVRYPTWQSPLQDCTVGTVENTKLDYGLFPNPTHNGHVTIQWANQGPRQIEIHNSLNQLVFSFTISSGSSIDLDLSHLQKGSYAVSLINEHTERKRQLLIIE